MPETRIGEMTNKGSREALHGGVNAGWIGGYVSKYMHQNLTLNLKSDHILYVSHTTIKSFKIYATSSGWFPTNLTQI